MYNSQDIAKRIIEEIQRKGYDQTAFLAQNELKEPTLRNMKKSMPNVANVAAIADGLNCSVDYLLGRTPCPDINISGNTQNNINGDNNINVNNNDELAGELSSLLKQLDIRKRTELMTMIYNFVDNNKG